MLLTQMNVGVESAHGSEVETVNDLAKSLMYCYEYGSDVHIKAVWV